MYYLEKNYNVVIWRSVKENGEWLLILMRFNFLCDMVLVKILITFVDD